MLMLSKRGSHVGVILSFAIFITFLVFLYLVLQPSLEIKEDKENLLQNLKVDLKEKFSSQIETIVFVINVTTTEDCVRLEDLVSQLKNDSIILKDEAGNIIDDFRNVNGDLLINRENVDEVFFKVYDSTEFTPINNESLSGCQLLSNESYIFKSVAVNKEIFLERINKTIEEYENNYDSLKEELHLPVASNFGFIFTDKKGLEMMTPLKNVSTSVYAEEIPILYVDDRANIKSGFLTIRVW